MDNTFGHSLLEREATAVASRTEATARTTTGGAASAPEPAPAGTGIDSSAGLATRVLTLALLPFTTVWEICKLVVRRFAGGSARSVVGITLLMVGAARQVGHVVGKFVVVGATVSWSLLLPLQVVLRWCGRGLRVLGRAVDRVLDLMGRVLGKLGRALGRSVAWAYGKVADVLLIVAVTLRIVGRLLAPALRGAARVVLTVLVAVATLVTLVLTVLVRPLVVCARVVLRLCARALRPLLACAVVIARVVAALGWNVAWLIARIIGLITGRLTVIGKMLASGLASMAVLLWRALTAVGRLAALIGGTGARTLAALSLAVARLVHRTCAPLFSALAVVARSVETRIVGPGVIAIGHASLTVVRSFTSVIVIAMRPLARAAGRGARATAYAIEAMVGRIFGTVRSSSGRVVQGSLVAFGTARHQARIPPRTGSIDGLALSSASGRSDDVDDRSYTAVFSATSHQNPYLRPGGTQVDAIVSVTADVGALDEPSREAVEIFLLDCSGSMGHPWDKIRALRKATRAALEILPDGVWFAIVRGAETADIVYPPADGLVQASPKTRKEAIATLASLQPVGGTAIGQWLALAARLSALRPGAIHHALLLTDGKDEDETAEELDMAVAASVGRFQCDCRGIGSDWAVSELRKISSALLGSVDIIRQPVDMEDDFRDIIDTALTRQVEAELQVWLPERATVRFIKQVSPTIEDLTAGARVIDGHTVEIPTGAWTTETREYHISVDVPPGPLDAEMLASKVSVMVGGRTHAQTLIKANWTDEASLFTLMNHEVAHYTDQAELAQAIQDGLEARRAGHERLATDKLGRAVQLAAQSGRHATSRLLADVVDVEDATTGRVTLKAYVEDADEMALDARSTRTNRSRSTFDTTSAAGRESATG